MLLSIFNLVVYFMNFLTLDYYISLSPDALHNLFIDFCKNGNIESIHLLLESPQLKDKVNVHHHQNYGLICAAMNGHTPIIHYLLTHPDPDIRCGIHDYNDNIFVWACSFQQIETIVFLLNSPLLIEHIFVDSNNGYLFNHGCRKGNIDMIKLAIYSNSIKGENILNKNNMYGFIHLLEYNHLDILESFINSSEENYKLNIYDLPSDFLNTLVKEAQGKNHKNPSHYYHILYDFMNLYVKYYQPAMKEQIQFYYNIAFRASCDLGEIEFFTYLLKPNQYGIWADVNYKEHRQKSNIYRVVLRLLENDDCSIVYLLFSKSFIIKTNDVNNIIKKHNHLSSIANLNKLFLTQKLDKNLIEKSQLKKINKL